MAQHKTVDVETKDIETAHAMWLRFTNLMKYSTMAAALVLVLMALFLL